MVVPQIVLYTILRRYFAESPEDIQSLSGLAIASCIFIGAIDRIVSGEESLRGVVACTICVDLATMKALNSGWQALLPVLVNS